ncbi:PadR family transcriptional regulator [Actinoplanes couchii]|uniref:PadR family transcriptional regulator n=1 Tax=Actinoplanes couchii TaxID=403638 RepID=A0ABQ3X3S7_9ACTN|nr:PadR family transcriptional regulator [Actinoplanes couchii]MDR6322933.1 PadR family transcriptional regulator PadR [Actinoplanes couchii]GID53173.1 PadR family transcriptional regulator [Actinoplanes couchii]
MDIMRERITTNIRKGVLEYCVLGLLARREMYGLELADRLVERGLIAGEGSLYPLLARMRQAGTVETHWQTPEQGHARRYYSVTPRGREQLGVFAAVWHDIRPHVDELTAEEE